MLFQRVNRTDPEKVFIVVFNSYGSASFSDGQAAMWDYPTDADGVGVTRPTARATSAGLAFAGIAVETIASGAYGLLQVYGFHTATRVRQDTSSAALNVAAGTPLALNAAGSVYCLEALDTGVDVTIVFPAGFALEANASWTTRAIDVFIKAL